MREKEALKTLACRIAELPYEKGFTQERVAQAIEVAESRRGHGVGSAEHRRLEPAADLWRARRCPRCAPRGFPRLDASFDGSAMVKAGVYRAAISMYVVFSVLFAPFMIASSFRWRDPGARQIFTMVAAAGVFCFVWIARFRIVITEEALFFRSLFGSSHVPRKAIRAAHISVRPSRFKGPIRLVVKYDGGREIEINAKVFSREAIAAVLALAPDQ